MILIYWKIVIMMVLIVKQIIEHVHCEKLVLDNQANVEILQDLILGQVEVQECQELLDSSLFLPVEHIEGSLTMLTDPPNSSVNDFMGDLAYDHDDANKNDMTESQTIPTDHPNSSVETDANNNDIDSIQDQHKEESAEEYSSETDFLQTPKRIRSNSSGKFEMKLSGTPTQLLRRKRDRERKQLNKGLSLFDKMAKFANANEEDTTYFVMFKKGQEVHFCGSKEYVAKFKNNEALNEFSEAMIETREEPLLRKINIAAAKKKAVKPSPSKGNGNMSFLPGLNLQLHQKEVLKATTPTGQEESIAINQDTIVNLKSRIFVRQRRKNPNDRCKEMVENNIENEMPTKKGKGRGRGRGRAK
ncbi:uncharacterized protein LOC143045500 isoform X1 [Mytilus galloprovincialis]|uniref:uncharacterized protein LOC143045500 isoform X1 n=1 Tax=Mytilus galloprovincialis TaxID=29158 RepID=UPI003F7B9A65